MALFVPIGDDLCHSLLYFLGYPNEYNRYFSRYFVYIKCTHMELAAASYKKRILKNSAKGTANIVTTRYCLGNKQPLNSNFPTLRLSPPVRQEAEVLS